MTDRPVLIEMVDIEKTYVVGEEKVRALRGVTFNIDRSEYVPSWGRPDRASRR